MKIKRSKTKKIRLEIDFGCTSVFHPKLKCFVAFVLVFEQVLHAVMIRILTKNLAKFDFF